MKKNVRVALSFATLPKDQLNSFAILAIVLIAMSGAVVDFTSVQQARSRSQTAIDAAALALQPRISIDST